jgi:hypothetical protein
MDGLLFALKKRWHGLASGYSFIAEIRLDGVAGLAGAPLAHRATQTQRHGVARHIRYKWHDSTCQ